MYPTAYVFALFLIISFPGGRNAHPNYLTVCQNNTITIECPTTPSVSSITIQNVFYGRGVSAICQTELTNDTTCSLTTAKTIVMGLCENKQKCTLSVTDDLFQPNPCNGISKYLNVTYNCLPDVGQGTVSACQDNFFNIQCPTSITIQRVFWGRQDSSICPPDLTSITNCSSSAALGIVRDLCDHQSNCTLNNTSEMFNPDPCPGTTKYLQVTYACLGDCPAGCATCSNTTHCLTCSAGKYKDTTNSSCLDCPAGCATCSNSTHCLTCSASFYQYIANSSCLGCPPGCAVCSDSTHCSSCVTDKYLEITNMSCLACRTCEDEKYESASCATIHDRECSDCRPECSDNSFEAVSCSGSYDRMCLACEPACERCDTATTCQKCVDGYYIDTSSSMCSECEVCGPFQYDSGGCDDGVSNRLCKACPWPCETCNEDRTCKSCECGHYLDLTKSTCEVCDTCTAKRYETQACCSSSNRQCEDCVSPCATCSNSTHCQSCLANFFLDTNDNSCRGCYTCQQNEYETRPCSSSANRLCSGCRTCQSNEYNTTDCTASTNRECFACPPACAACSNASICMLCIPGFYWDTINGSCRACRTCASTQFESRVCATAHDRNCTVCSTCAVNQYEARTCSYSTDRQCPDCESPCATCSSSATCESCIAGYYLESCNKTCRACWNCTSTQYETRPCSNSNNRKCHEIYEERCLDKTFFDQYQRQCLPWVCSRPKYWFKNYRDICDYWWCSISIPYRRNFRIRCARVQTMFFF